MDMNFAYELQSDKSFDDVVESIEKTTPEHSFRILAVHNVQETLAEKGLERGPLKIIELCNAPFAHSALQKDMDVSLFMPCRYSVYTENNKTIVKLNRPSMIAQMMPESGLTELAEDVENTLKKIMEESI